MSAKTHVTNNSNCGRSGLGAQCFRQVRGGPTDPEHLATTDFVWAMRRVWRFKGTAEAGTVEYFVWRLARSGRRVGWSA